jgi:hypothetical protein
MNGILPQSTRTERHGATLGWALAAFCLGLAIDANDGSYSQMAIIWLTFAGMLSMAAVALSTPQRIDLLARRCLTAVLLVGICLEGAMLTHETHADSTVITGLLLVTALGCLQALVPPRLRWPLRGIMVIAFAMVSILQFRHFGFPGIDVFVFQMKASAALAHGGNPYVPGVVQFPNVYSGKWTERFYGPGVVDQNNNLTYGFPYPPMSLLMVLPSYFFGGHAFDFRGVDWGGDIRFSLAISMALSAGLMAAARPGRWGALAAALFLLTPRSLYVVDLAWTEPLLTLNFSIVMFCACRCRKMLPYALGLYFATKQYTILSLPAVVLLVEGADLWRELWGMLWRAGLVVAAITTPFFVWNPREFIRAVVLWQLVQPFREDALSYLVLIYRHNGFHRPPIWTPFIAIIPAAGLAVWRGARSPAGFAAGVTLINLAFFAFNKQAFCNYYYFVMASSCWVVAATRPPVFSENSALAVQS